MRLFSTNNINNQVSLKEAVQRSMPEDKGLYLPKTIGKLSNEFLNNLSGTTIQDIGIEVCNCLFDREIPKNEIVNIVKHSIDFPAPLISLDDKYHVLELWHGPSLAFKDFGARFMSQLMSYFNQYQQDVITILVATSGDTGGAVAAGFLNTPGIKVKILYPKHGVTDLQERQLTTLGGNIEAFRVDGVFDDCQNLVKSAFLDKELNKSFNLSSANSINIARLIPQSFYYFEGYKQLKDKSKKTIVSVPSGNFGNLTAGLLAKTMGLPIDYFIAANNKNDTVVRFLDNGRYEPRKTIHTISNAMDVSDPSNFKRIDYLFDKNLKIFNQQIKGYSFNDIETKNAIQEIFKHYKYSMDPHGAVAYLGAKTDTTTDKNLNMIILETAHPCKFAPTMDECKITYDFPKQLEKLMSKEIKAIDIKNNFTEFKNILLDKK